MAKIEDWLGASNVLGIDIWKKKYQYNDESFESWLDRISGNNKDIRKLIMKKKFLFGGRILANRGVSSERRTYSNCYVLPVDDSIESIYKTAGDMAVTYKAGGGVGVDISALAPKGAKVNNAARTTSGSVSFIDLFTTTTGLIGQCIEGTQRVLTPNGLKEIKDVVVGDAVWTQDGFKPVIRSLEQGVKEVYEVTTKMGYKIRVTDNHTMVSINKGDIIDIQLKDLSIGSEIVIVRGLYAVKESPSVYAFDAINSISSTTPGIFKTDDKEIKFGTTLYADIICNITEVGELETYDITLDGENRFWCEGFYVHNSGRRGALMVSISCDHPDIEDFVKLKSDVTKATTANLSVRVTDDFMKAVENDEDWFTAFTRKETGECISKVFKAKDLFSLFCDTNYDYGEPGLLFWDRIEKWNMLSEYKDFKFIATNPCFTGDTKILTDKGYIEIRELCDKEVTIWNGYEWSVVRPQITGYNQPILKVSFSDGSSVKCTDYHKFILSDSSRKEAKDIKAGDKIVRCTYPVISGGKHVEESIAYTNGFYSGDGFYNTEKKTPAIILYDKKLELVDFISKRIKHNTTSTTKAYLALNKNEGMNNGVYDKKYVPNVEYDIDTRLNWLAGLIDSDGTLNDRKGSLTISSIDRDFLYDIKLMLNTLGINTTLSVMKKECMKEMPTNDGLGGVKEYHCAESYRIVFNASSVRSLVVLGLHTHRVPLVANPSRSASRFIRVTNVERIDREPIVYCMTEKKNHSVIANGVITGQCGELPLPAGGACLLGSMNLAEYVNSDMTFDFDDFGKDVRIAINALDEVQTEGIPLHPLEIQRKTAEDWKQLGLGIMGLGDMLIKMNIRYGSPESITLCDKIGGAMIENAIAESMKLGEEKGSFRKFKSSNTEESKFFQMHAIREEKAPTKCSAMRNSQLLAIAPTGSISTMIGVSGGIEPLFALEYERTTKSLYGKDMTYKVIPSVVQEARDRGLTEGLVCSQDIAYIDRIKMQSAWQNSIDGSISSTINLPNNCPREDIEKIYLTAWNYDLKGVTIFRDGCKREGILKKDAPIEEHEIIGLRRTIQTGCGRLHVVGMFDKENGNVREVFMNRGADGGCNSFMVGLSRMVSLSARKGADLDEIIDQLTSCPTCPSYAVRRATKGDTAVGNCCPSAVGKVLVEMSEEAKGFNLKKEQKPITTGEKCPQCGETLIHTNSCKSCLSCGWSKCS